MTSAKERTLYSILIIGMLIAIWCCILFVIYNQVAKEQPSFDPPYQYRKPQMSEPLVLFSQNTEIKCRLYHYNTDTNMLSLNPDDGFVDCDGDNFDTCRLQCAKDGEDTHYLVVEGDETEALKRFQDMDLRLEANPGSGLSYDGTILNVHYRKDFDQTIACFIPTMGVMACGRDCRNCSSITTCNRGTMMAAEGTLLAREDAAYQRA